MSERIECIGYPQVETLIRRLGNLRTLLESLEVELTNLYLKDTEFIGSKDDVLYSLAVCNKVLSDMPFGSPSPGDKVTSIIANYENNLRNEVKDISKDIASEIKIIADVIKLMQRALSELNTKDKFVISSFYFEKKTWKEIGSSLGIDADMAKLLRRDCLNAMLTGLKIPLADFGVCMMLLERENIKEEN